MKHLPFRRIAVSLVALVLVSVVPVAASAQSKDDVDKAKSAADRTYQQLIEADERLEAGLEELERIDGQIYSLEWRISRLEDAIVEYGGNMDSLDERAKLIVYEAYTSNGSSLLTTAFSTGDIQDLITSRALIDAATTRNLSQIDQLAAVSRQMDRLGDDLTVKEAEVQKLREAQAVVIEQLEIDRASADKLHAQAKKTYAAAYARYKAEQARKAAAAAARAAAARTATGGSSGGGGAAAGVPAATEGVNCPLPDGSSFIDTWGYPRSGGRTHKGTDMIAGYGSRLVAMRSGTIRMNYNSLGGRQVYIYGDDGITYYYAHLSSYPSGQSSGQRVNQGDVVGFVGSTGNATTNVLHLGFIVGGQYVNPYPTVRRAC